MTHFLSIPIALGQAAALQGRRPTAEQYARIKGAVLKHIVIDLDTSAAAICYDDGLVVDLGDFVANQLAYPDIESRSIPGATPPLTDGF